MLLVRYFLYVGGVLVVLLLATSAFAPKPQVVSSADSGFDRSVIRIHSEQKLPERVVFDTTAPVIAAVPAAPIIASAPPAPTNIATISPTARVRETFAQFVPAAEPKKPQLKTKAVRSAKVRVAPSAVRFAQQQRFGFTTNNFGFAGNNIW
jgi:hypothetical protein